MNKLSNKLSIVIPCFNEQEALPILLPDLVRFAKENSFLIVLVNDGSKDRTKEILADFKCNIVQVISHKINKGYGAAIKTGISVCETEFIITIDADGQHELKDILRLLEVIQLKDADMVIGSREGLNSASIMRAVGKYFIRKLVKILLHDQLFDINSGMKIYKTTLAKEYLNLCPNGMPYSDIIALIFIHNHHLVIEESITLNERIGGKSTISYKTAFETVNEIFNIIILFNPMRIFFPLSILFFVSGIGWGSYFVFTGKGITVGSGLLITLSVIVFLMGLIAEQLSSIRKSLNNK